MSQQFTHRLCIAPMMDHSDRHFRFLMRLLSRHAVLYTEMITTGALLHGDRQRFLKFNPVEHPVAIQLGGSDPTQLASCAVLAEDEGYDEINLNIGCPSDRVQNGQFGACLMSNPRLVADCVASINAKVKIPVTVKTRIGIDNDDDYGFLQNFISQVGAAGCNTFIIHARKAMLSGLSPKENREIPPLNYPRVHQVKQEFPGFNIVLNGGLTTSQQVQRELAHIDGVMIGRAAYQNPYWLARLEQLLFHGDVELPSRELIYKTYCEYMLEQAQRGERLKNMSRHIIGLFQSQPGARQFRRILSSSHAEAEKTGADILERALDSVSCMTE